MKIILASASKRRLEILRSCGMKVSVMVSNAHEEHPGKHNIKKTLVLNAKIKAMSVASRLAAKTRAVVIGADTLVLCGDMVIGKPSSAGEAKKILKRLSGKRVGVFTGLYVYNTVSRSSAASCVKSAIQVSGIQGRDVNKLFSRLGPYDKAGGFSIEGVGSMIFDDIRGSYFNILGLPTSELRRLFKKIGLDILEFCSC